MGRYIDNAPIAHTCPSIDNVIEEINYAQEKVALIKENPKKYEEDYEEQMDTIIEQLGEAMLDMEKIRKDNETLREFGNSQFYRAEEAESRRNDTLKQYDVLELEINYLREQLKEEVEYDK
jgi:dynactin complex subunit